MKEKIVPLILAAVGAVLAIGVLTFAGPCVHDDGTVAACFAASRAVIACGIVACISGLLGAALRGIQTSMVLSVIGIVAGILAIAFPGGIMPLCMMQTMHCWSVMRPFALIMGAVVAIVAAVMLLQAFSRRRQAQKAARRMAR